MQTVTIKTSQNIDIDYEVAGLGDRILAYLLDFALFIAVFIMGVIITSLSTLRALNEAIIIVLVCVYFALYVFYDLLCEIFMGGQTIGKRVLKIKVVSLNGAQPTIGQYLLRWLFRIVDFSITSNLCALITVAVTEKHQRVGDIVAGTTLIKTQPRTKIDSIAFKPADETYEPLYPQAAQLTDRDVELMHEVIQTYLQTGNNVVVYNMAAKVKEVLQITVQEEQNSLMFLQTLIKDYNHLQARETAL